MVLTEFLTGIADAIREKKGTTDPINAQNFASEIAAISSGGGGRKTTTGTVTFTEAAVQQTITHNLGSVPSCFILYPKDLSVIPTSGTEEAKGTAWKFAYVNNTAGGIAVGVTYQGNTNTGNLLYVVDTDNAVAAPSATETTVTTGASGSGYKFPADVEFEWIAIEDSTEGTSETLHTSGTVTLSSGYNAVTIAHGLSKAPKLFTCFLDGYESKLSGSGCGFTYTEKVATYYRNSDFSNPSVGAVHVTVPNSITPASGAISVDDTNVYITAPTTQWQAGDYKWEAHTW